MGKVLPLSADTEKFGRLVATKRTEQGEWTIHFKASDNGLDYELSCDGNLVALAARTVHARMIVDGLIRDERGKNPAFMCSEWIDA